MYPRVGAKLRILSTAGASEREAVGSLRIQLEQHILPNQYILPLCRHRKKQ
jgi:hypothetical protein